MSHYYIPPPAPETPRWVFALAWFLAGVCFIVIATVVAQIAAAEWVGP